MQSVDFYSLGYDAPSSVEPTGRNAGYSLSGTNIRRHYGAGGNYGIVADADTFEDDRVRADPDVVADLDRSFDERLIRDRPLFAKSMIVVSDVTEWPYHTSSSDVYALRCIKHGKPIDVCSG